MDWTESQDVAGRLEDIPGYQVLAEEARRDCSVEVEESGAKSAVAFAEMDGPIEPRV